MYKCDINVYNDKIYKYIGIKYIIKFKLCK